MTYCLYLSATLHLYNVKPRKVKQTPNGIYFVYDTTPRNKDLCKKFSQGKLKVNAKLLASERIAIKNVIHQQAYTTLELPIT